LRAYGVFTHPRPTAVGVWTSRRTGRRAGQQAFAFGETPTAHARRASSRLVGCATDSSAVPFDAALATLIKGQRSTASADAAAQPVSGRIMRRHDDLGVSVEDV